MLINILSKVFLIFPTTTYKNKIKVKSFIKISDVELADWSSWSVQINIRITIYFITIQYGVWKMRVLGRSSPKCFTMPTIIMVTTIQHIYHIWLWKWQVTIQVLVYLTILSLLQFIYPLYTLYCYIYIIYMIRYGNKFFVGFCSL